MSRKIELMAPAGNFAALTAAGKAGADSVYFGVEQLNMRARATMNFTVDDLDKVVELCKEYDMRSYITLNTIIYDHDLSLAKKIIETAKNAGITAIIAADQAVIGYAHSIGFEVHISTQANITNVETVKFYSLFSDTMVLSRELSMKQMKNICDTIEREQIKGPNGNLVEIEVFAHGAICVAVSGKCYMSLHTHNASANRGACIQNCRRAYTVIDKETGYELEVDNEYIMSPKDLCTVDFLDSLIETGVTVLKVEGRGKAPEYVKTVIETYRAAIDAVQDGTYSQEKIEGYMEQLSSVYNRGFWGGYYLGQKLGEFSSEPGSLASQKKVYIGKGMHYYPKVKVGEFKMDSHSLKKGDKILIIGPTTGVLEHVVEGMRKDDKAVEEVRKGDEFTISIDETIRSSDRLYKMVEA
jgi:U32 family peptidase